MESIDIRNLADTPVRSRPILRQGDTGEWVSELQRQLMHLTFYNGPINGIFDTPTNTAVRNFQQNNRLTVDGIVGQNVWSSLIVLYSPLAICDGGISGETQTHTVVAGDTLFSIAQRYGTTVDELMRLNNLTSTALSIGQLLIVSQPSTTPPPISIARPTIRQGDRGETVRELQEILTNLGYQLGAIDGIFGSATANAVKEFQKREGLVADAIVGPATWTKLLAAISSPEESFIYTVVAGDTLFSIAQRFNTTVNEIMRINNLTSSALSIGQKLIIPAPAGSTTVIHIVVAGDTLWSIARRFNTTVDAIMQLNNMTTNALSIGQQLLIPS